MEKQDVYTNQKFQQQKIMAGGIGPGYNFF